MDNRKRYASAGIVAVVALLIGVLAFSGSTSNGEIGVLDGVYEMNVDAKEVFGTACFRMSFDAGTMTYEQTVTLEDGKSLTLDSGSYAQGDGQVQVFSETSDESSKVYMIEGDMIKADEFVYDGETLPSSYEKAE